MSGRKKSTAAAPTVPGKLSDIELEQIAEAIAEPGIIEHIPEPISQAFADLINASIELEGDEVLNGLGVGELALAGVCYAMTPAWRDSKDRHGHPIMRTLWPLPLFEFNPTPDDRRSELVRGAALLIAEVERMDAATVSSSAAIGVG